MVSPRVSGDLGADRHGEERMPSLIVAGRYEAGGAEASRLDVVGMLFVGTHKFGWRMLLEVESSLGQKEMRNADPFESSKFYTLSHLSFTVRMN